MEIREKDKKEIERKEREADKVMKVSFVSMGG